MKVLISTLDDKNYDEEVEVSHLNYEREGDNFWMPCVMGDDWLQRINSSHALDAKPSVVRIEERIGFVVFASKNEAESFRSWLVDAEEQVREGYQTMRG